jgi:membrane fusion protein (multidrug efflux system)
MTARRKYLYIIGGMILFGALFLWRISSGDSNADIRRQIIPAVKTEHPLRQTVVYTLIYTADVVAIQQASIYAKVSGTLDRVYVDMGSSVRRGQMLALIDTTELFQTRQQAAATAQNARLTYRRTKDLFDQKLVAAQDLENAEAAMKVAVAALDVATTRLDYARITAPFSGTITKRYLDPGAVVSALTSTIFTLMDLDEMKIIINVLEQDIPHVTMGLGASVTVDAFPGKKFTGKVSKFAQAVDLATRTMAVEIDIPNPSHLLRPGMFATASVDVGQHEDAITLPTQAVLKDDQGLFVYVARGDTARRVRVTAGSEQNSRTEILSGLDGTEDVITTGQQFVRTNGPVEVQK